MLLLRATANSYDWGKPASESLVARYARLHLDRVDPALRYSELWVGTHPNGTASIADSGEEGQQSLKDWLAAHPRALCLDGIVDDNDNDDNDNDNKFKNVDDDDNGLCFLFKILSIGKALSIQAHPNQQRARELFQLRPDLYKDANHKPEMACALTDDFEALLGFQDIATICQHARRTPELVELAGNEAWEALQRYEDGDAEGEAEGRREALKSFFFAVLSSAEEDVASSVARLVARLGNNTPDDPLDALALRLHSQFPHDVGVFCAYLLCYARLRAGEAVFLTSNEPHAYLSGECVEVMANSDNVVRAALTPKFKDLAELHRMLTYNEPTGSSSSHHPSRILLPVKRDACTVVFRPPDAEVWEFQLERTTLQGRLPPYKLAPASYASVMFVTECGEGSRAGGHVVHPGSAFLLPAGQSALLALGKQQKQNSRLVVYRVTRRSG